MNLILISAICVNARYLRDGVSGDEFNAVNNQFYQRLWEEMINNKYNEVHNIGRISWRG